MRLLLAHSAASQLSAFILRLLFLLAGLDSNAG
jgi:hypothetical protein